jgi:DNA-binding CsgD family transcriptional regulator
VYLGLSNPSGHGDRRVVHLTAHYLGLVSQKDEVAVTGTRASGPRPAAWRLRCSSAPEGMTVGSGRFNGCLDEKEVVAALRKALDRAGLSRVGRWIAEEMARWGRALGLTPSEMLVAELLLLGLSNKEIAQERGVSPSTVRIQVSRCLLKAGADSRGAFAFKFFLASWKRFDASRALCSMHTRT